MEGMSIPPALKNFLFYHEIFLNLSIHLRRPIVSARGMPEHMEMHRAEFRPPRRRFDEVIHGWAGHGLIALGQEQPRQRIASHAEITFDEPATGSERKGNALIQQGIFEF
jgi:hypothetical protein